jgi:hypothetical protein
MLMLASKGLALGPRLLRDTPLVTLGALPDMRR